jgi:hypothetical protein
VRLSSCGSIGLGCAALLAPGPGAAQAPQYRLAYHVEVVRVTSERRETLAVGDVSGPVETGLRLSLRGDSIEIEALFGVYAESDTVTLAAEFFAKRWLGRTRRGLPLWEQDGYARLAQLAWGDTARIHPLGPPQPGARDSLWVDLVVTRSSAGGETRPAETLALSSGPFQAVVEAVVRPRRAVVAIQLVRGKVVSPPRRYDFVPEGAARRLALARPGGFTRTLDIGLTRPEAARSVRDRALALDADVVCLRVAEPDSTGPVGVVCGRLNNVARRVPLSDGDTLVATFAWPGAR